MSLYVECKPDETLAFALGIPRRDVEHSLNRPGVCAQLARRNGAIGMVDEDPDTAPQPYMKTLAEETWEHSIRVLRDPQRNNRLVVISPRLEEWLVQSAKSAGLKMTDFGFESDSGLHLHREINQRLDNLKRLIEALLAAKNPRILRLQSLIKQAQ
jgi:hypothetical protein